jgi:hypothetical protein
MISKTTRSCIAATVSCRCRVSKRYQVVQPREVLEFYRDLVEVGGFVETAGVLKGGRKSARPRLARGRMRGGDRVAYLLLATARRHARNDGPVHECQGRLQQHPAWRSAI